MRAGLLPVAALCFATSAMAQETVRGTVTDASTGRPVAGAIVTLGPEGLMRSTRTDELGRFVISGLLVGHYPFVVRNLGYAPHEEGYDVVADPPAVSVSLRRLQRLDTITVRSVTQGVFGVVATSRDLRPLPNATLRVVGVGSGSVSVDSGGHFAMPIKTLGTYVLRATAPGYEAQTISIVAAPNQGVEVALLLDSATRGPIHRYEVAYSDFDERFKKRGALSALISRTDLLKDRNADLISAIMHSQSFAKSGLRFSEEACVFIDGIPQVAKVLSTFDVETIEAIEVYGRRADRSGTLKWPAGFPCPTTGFPRLLGSDQAIRYVVVWLKP